MIRFDNMPPEVMQAMCTPMHEILPRAALPTASSSSHPSSASPYAPYSHSQQQQPPMSGALYLGGLTAMNDPSLLRQHNIRHFVQVIEAAWAPPCRADDTSYGIDIRDKENVDLRPYLEGACQYIERSLRTGSSVLIHCQQGISRSSAIVIAFLIRNHGMTYDSALAYVKRKRACVKPNPGFARALMEWEAAWRSSNRPGMQRRFTS
ncbi:hypothetical protein MIND_00586300 [Mycena indigotica]|uniref:protein-tyrosine-phosphatase n=1 Tax=Mycena indigotica TaxID=2126181 RepID=A0A8H6SR83_9AGAR|nr:uncharacterized protein MIND_00586300 [Mycena indigotica]KAF7303570.1 hypothetical protein MIND_00586300 [Mycena indigotica]